MDRTLWDDNPLWPKNYVPSDPRQLKLDLVEPLTEQLKLDLDFTPCHQYQNRLTTIPAGSHGTTLGVVNGTNATWVSANASTLEVPNLTMKYDEKPNMVRRVLLKLLGMKWKVDK